MIWITNVAAQLGHKYSDKIRSFEKVDREGLIS